jgi:hypothetical protein
VESLEVEDYGAGGLDGALSYFGAYAYVSFPVLFPVSPSPFLLIWGNRGMQTVWVMGNETEVLGKVPTPEVQGYLTFGGDVYGNESHWPSVVNYDDNWAVNQ